MSTPLLINVSRWEDRYDNAAQARAVIRGWDDRKRDYPNGVHIECFNEDEANEIRAEIARLRPDIQTYFSWRFAR